jgi:hypothetical protein
MSDPRDAEQSSVPKEEDQKQLSHYKKVIFPLETQVRLVNRLTNSKIDVTLNVKGTMVSGSMG